MKWDPEQYGKYAGQRLRPFVDLIERIRTEAPRHVVDLGCGPGNATTLLTQKWPGAHIEGIDSSADMIGKANALGSNISFRVGDVTDWTPEGDVILSNATLHWVPTHEALLRRWAAALPVGGSLAFQVPGNFEAPSHTVFHDLAREWKLTVKLDAGVRTPSEYAALFLEAGLEVDAWETTYVHVLEGEDAVLEWIRGTALRPILTQLSSEDGARFLEELAPRLRAAYPKLSRGTLMPFRRIFVVGQKVTPAKT